MAKKNFLLLSLEDKEIKKVANIVGNDSCKKILDFLSENEGTETEIAKKLTIPLSTVHYNLQQLVEAGLIEADEYHYSEKGKEVLHYKLANKYIIIAPKKEKSNLLHKLKGILPVGLIALGAAFVIHFTQKYFSVQPMEAAETAAPMMQKAVAEEVAADSAMMMAATAPEPVVQSASILQSIGIWFLIGALFALILVMVFNYWRKE